MHSLPNLNTADKALSIVSVLDWQLLSLLTACKMGWTTQTECIYPGYRYD